MPKNRTTVDKSVMQDVLLKSRRRCCLCYAAGIDRPVDGQIAHITADRSDSSEDNLVFLCLDHHRQFDSSGKRAESADDLKHKREKLYADKTGESEHRTMWDRVYEYEDTVLNAIKSELLVGSSRDAVIHQRPRLNGRSGHTHEVDIAIDVSVGGITLLLVVEIKYYKRRVGIEQILSFNGLLEDIGANKGIFVSSSGFSKAAIQHARSRGIALAIVSDDTDMPQIEWLDESATTRSHITK